MIMLYSSKIRCSESGVLGANKTSKRSSMSSERLGDNMSQDKLDRKWEALPLGL